MEGNYVCRLIVVASLPPARGETRREKFTGTLDFDRLVESWKNRKIRFEIEVLKNFCEFLKFKV